MIGNDIVDYKEAARQSNWNRRRYLNKVFNEREQCLIRNTQHANQMVWRLWSMKESAYKAYVRQTKNTFFNPLKLSCSITNNQLGIVHVLDQTFKTHTEYHSEYLYTSIVHPTLKTTECIQTMSDKEPDWLENMTIRKDAVGIPKLYVQSNPLPILISKTHHGNYLAYSVLIENPIT